ncbi:MAG: hypothetical protein K2N72_01215 [Oscillospiraceae bacterium]|nr:hypothetical protein [Oscillospiraceae bacterium]
MIDGKASTFIENLYFEDNIVIYRDEKFYFNGCQTKWDSDGKIKSVRLEVYNLTKDETVLSIVKPSDKECIEAFENAPLWNGRTFWEAEAEMLWVDE